MVPNSALTETLTDVYDQCRHTFLTSLEANVNRLLEQVQPPTQDLVPSLGIAQLLNLLRDVLSGGHIVDAQPSDVAEVCLQMCPADCVSFNLSVQGCATSCGSFNAVHRRDGVSPPSS